MDELGDIQADTSACPICESKAHLALHKNDYRIDRCSSCDFLRVAPYPTAQELAEFYNQQYRAASSDFYPKAASRRRRARLRALKFVPYVFGKTVLEVGCGGGFMSNALALYAKRVVGVDLSSSSIAYASAHFKKPEFRCSSIEDIPAEPFDFVMSSELMEHVPGVKSIMECLERTTRAGSIVYISTPDASHPKTPKTLSEWSDICPPEHIQWFGHDNLVQIFDRYGFDLSKNFSNPKPAHSLLFKRR